MKTTPFVRNMVMLVLASLIVLVPLLDDLGPATIQAVTLSVALFGCVFSFDLVISFVKFPLASEAAVPASYCVCCPLHSLFFDCRISCRCLAKTI
jgi:hypothetical protein